MKKDFSYKEGNTGQGKNHLLSEGFTFCAALVLVVSLVFSVLTSILEKSFDFKSTGAYVFISYFLMSVAVFFGGFIAVKRRGYTLREVAPLRFDKRALLITFLVLLGTYFGLSGVNQWFSDFLGGFGYVVDEPIMAAKTPLNVIFSIIFICVIPAISEEFLFRGVLVKGTGDLGVGWCLLITGAAFSLYHTSPNQTIYQFIVGVIYTLIAVKTRSVLPTIILHFLNNFLVVMWYYFYPDFSLSGTAQIVTTVLGLCTLALAVYLIYRWYGKGEKRRDLTRETRWEFALSIVPGFIVFLTVWIANLVA